LSPSAGSAPARDDTSYRAQLDYPGDRYAVQVERLKIGTTSTRRWVRARDDMVRDFARFRFSPRPRARRAGVVGGGLQASAIRKYVFEASMEYIENGAGRLGSRERASELALEFQKPDRFGVTTELVRVSPAPFPIGERRLADQRLQLRYAAGWLQQTSSARSLPTCQRIRHVLDTRRRSVPRASDPDHQPARSADLSFNRVTLVQGAFTTPRGLTPHAR
jgi:hypothetical protein